MFAPPVAYGDGEVLFEAVRFRSACAGGIGDIADTAGDCGSGNGGDPDSGSNSESESESSSGNSSTCSSSSSASRKSSRKSREQAQKEADGYRFWSAFLFKK